MSKNNKNRDNAHSSDAQHEAATAGISEASAHVSPDAGAAVTPKRRKLGGWAITGIAAAGLVLLTGTATAGALAGTAISHEIAEPRGGHEFADEPQFEHERGGERGEMRKHDGDHMQGLPSGPQMHQRNSSEDQQSTDGETSTNPEEQLRGGQTQGGQMQMRPKMDGQTGAS